MNFQDNIPFHDEMEATTYVPTAIPFEIGNVVMTQGVNAMIYDNKEIDLFPYLVRHARGDWGNLDIEDKILNDEATKKNERVLSSYDVDGETFWIITERDRSCTTFLLPSEY